MVGTAADCFLKEKVVGDGHMLLVRVAILVLPTVQAVLAPIASALREPGTDVGSVLSGTACKPDIACCIYAAWACILSAVAVGRASLAGVVLEGLSPQAWGPLLSGHRHAQPQCLAVRGARWRLGSRQEHVACAAAGLWCPALAAGGAGIDTLLAFGILLVLQVPSNCMLYAWCNNVHQPLHLLPAAPQFVPVFLTNTNWQPRWHPHEP